MTASDAEIEVKFYVEHLSDLSGRMQGIGAGRLAERVRELNLRFDTRDRTLARQGRALRLRQDSITTLTYKGPSHFGDGIRSRTEMEVEVQDLMGARRLLEALDYTVTFTYEKYRTTYGLGKEKIMLDELPYGDFVEVEGDAPALRAIAKSLGLRWAAAVRRSYLGLFEHVQRRLNLPFSDLTFENFRGLTVRPDDLGVTAADN